MSANVYTTTIKNRSTITSEKPVQLTAAAKCDPGDRENQDSAYLKLDDSSIFVAVVADGVGGLANGGLVSGYITKAIEVWFNETISELRTLSIDEVQYEMKRVTDKTHEDLLAVAEETGQRHGSTMTFVILGKKKYALVQVGDSRAYLSNGNWVTRITKDQTVEEYEKKTGKTFDNLSKERKKHIDAVHGRQRKRRQCNQAGFQALSVCLRRIHDQRASMRSKGEDTSLVDEVSYEKM